MKGIYSLIHSWKGTQFRFLVIVIVQIPHLHFHLMTVRYLKVFYCDKFELPILWYLYLVSGMDGEDALFDDLDPEIFE